jgi:hypothetical protein
MKIVFRVVKQENSIKRRKKRRAGRVEKFLKIFEQAGSYNRDLRVYQVKTSYSLNDEIGISFRPI